jgi:sugar phosphate isomerase/epimerase
MITLSYNLGNHSPRLESTLTLADHVRAVGASGFRHIGLDDWTLDRWEQSGGDSQSLRDLLTSHELTCSDVGPLRIGGERATLDAMSRLADAASVLSASWIPVVVGSTEPAALLRRCAAIAAEVSIGLAVEFIPWTSAPTLAAARRLVDEVGHPSVRLLLDVFQLSLSGGSWSEVAALPTDIIGLVQLSDALPKSDDLVFDSSHRRALPGTGELDLQPLRQVLVDLTWDGIVSLEVLSAELRAADPHAVAVAAHRTASACLFS